MKTSLVLKAHGLESRVAAPRWVVSGFEKNKLGRIHGKPEEMSSVDVGRQSKNGERVVRSCVATSLSIMVIAECRIDIP
ncbi:hypothetical protein Tco_1478187 [Tanacetum coccineum]